MYIIIIVENDSNLHDEFVHGQYMYKNNYVPAFSVIQANIYKAEQRAFIYFLSCGIIFLICSFALISCIVYNPAKNTAPVSRSLPSSKAQIVFIAADLSKSWIFHCEVFSNSVGNGHISLRAVVCSLFGGLHLCQVHMRRKFT